MMQMRCTQPPSGKAALAATRHRASLPVLTTARLELRAPTMNDLPAWTAIHQGEGSEFIGGPVTAEGGWEGFAIYVAGWLLHGHGLFTASLRETGEVAGFVSLGLEWGDDEPELGYMFDAAHRGQGLATEACAAVRDFGFGLLGEGRFVSYVKAQNTRSNALAERLGAVRDTATEAGFDADQHVWRHGGSA